MKRGKTYSGIRWYISGTLLIGLLFSLFWCSSVEEPDTSRVFEHEKIAPPVIPDSITFCEERVPIEYFDIKESLERELIINTYWHSQTILFIQRANRYFPIIEPILEKNGLPDDFKYLPLIESGFANIVSPAGAAGYWQILETTAKDYGLEVNEEVDERYHIEKATNFACRFLNESYLKFGSWTMAAASYNVGRAGVTRQIERQKTNNYYDLLFNDETARYIFRIIAIKLIIENPDRYNFIIPEKKLYQPIPNFVVEVNSPIESWADFATEHNTNYKMLKILNPWLRDDKLTNKQLKSYTIKIPEKNSRLVE